MWKHKFLTGTFVLLLLVGSLLIGCQSSEQMTPTPFPPTPDNEALGIGGSLITPVPAVLADVVANPEFYEGAYLQVTGQYFRKPLQVCGTDPHPSPAGWDLITGETVVPAGGFDAQLRQLMPDGITMTVIGRFTQWRGPVGCGKQAVPKEMWYLDVVKLVDPAQLARVTLTPGSAPGELTNDGIITDDLFTPIAESEEPPSDGNDFLPTSPPVAPPTNTVQPTRVVPIETLGAGFTPVATGDIGVSTPDASRTETAVTPTQGTAVSTGTVTVQSSPSGVRTVTNTPPPGTTSTPTPSSIIATVTTTSGSVINMGDAFFDQDLDEVDFEVAGLEAGKIHDWILPLDENDEVILNVIGEPDMDIGMKILDDDLIVLESEDDNGTGQSEFITFKSPQTGDYHIRVSEGSGKSGGYLLTLSPATFSSSDFLYLPQGMLTYGANSNGIISSFEDHYWFLNGAKDDVIDVAISCDVEAELAVTLYDADGADIADLFFEEDMQNVLLTETGWYVFAVGLWDDVASCQYDLIVTKQ